MLFSLAATQNNSSGFFFLRLCSEQVPIPRPSVMILDLCRSYIACLLYIATARRPEYHKMKRPFSIPGKQ